MTTLIVLVVLAIVIGWLVSLYNKVIAGKNQVENMQGSIDTALKMRFDLIPNLVSTVKEYMSHEKELLTRVTELRSNANNIDNLSMKEKSALNNELTSAMGAINIAVEAYPELQASDNMIHLQKSLNEVESQISAARRSYNQAVTNYNNNLEMIPTNFIANYLRYEKKDVFEVEEAERKTPDVKNLFN